MKQFEYLKCKYCNNKSKIPISHIKADKLKNGDILCDSCIKNQEKVRKFAGISKKRWQRIMSPTFKLSKKDAETLRRYEGKLKKKIKMND